MESSLNFEALAASQPDAETFERVWKRVMPDPERSLVQLKAPKAPPGAGKQTQPPCALIPFPDPQGPSAPQGGLDAVQLKELIDLAQTCHAKALALTRRLGTRGKGLSALVQDHRDALCQLSTHYFILTGAPVQPKTISSALPTPPHLALREQFLLEQQWETACFQLAQRRGDPTLPLLDFSRQGASHAQSIRTLLWQFSPFA